MIEAFGISAVILTIHWAINIKVRSRFLSSGHSFPQGGVTYVENMGIPFNWHPILMTISLIFLYGNGEIFNRHFVPVYILWLYHHLNPCHPCSGALIYRIIPPKNEGHKLKLKLAHAGIMIVAFALMVIGLQVL